MKDITLDLGLETKGVEKDLDNMGKKFERTFKLNPKVDELIKNSDAAIDKITKKAEADSAKVYANLEKKEADLAKKRALLRLEKKKTKDNPEYARQEKEIIKLIDQLNKYKAELAPLEKRESDFGKGLPIKEQQKIATLRAEIAKLDNEITVMNTHLENVPEVISATDEKTVISLNADIKKLKTDIKGYKTELETIDSTKAQQIDEVIKKTGIDINTLLQKEREAKLALEATMVDAEKRAKLGDQSVRKTLMELKQIPQYTLRANKALQDLDKALMAKQIEKALKRVNASIKSVINGYKKIIRHIKQFSKEAIKASKHTSVLTQNIKKFILAGIGVRSIYFAFRKFWTMARSGRDILAQLDEETNNAMSSMKTSTYALQNQIGSLFSMLTITGYPLIVRLTDALTALMDRLTQVVAILKGQSTYKKANKVWQDYAESLDKTKSSAKDLEHQLSGLDEINRWQDNKGAGDTNLGDLFTDAPVDEIPASIQWVKDFRDKFLEAWNNAWDTSLWQEAGAILNRGLAGIFDTIYEYVKWDNISQEFKDRLLGIIEMINEFIRTPDMWLSMGSALGAGFNTAVHIAWSVLNGINWTELGNSLALSINNALIEVDWTMVGETVAAWFLRLPMTIVGIIQGLDMTLLGTSVRDFLIGAINYAVDWLTTTDWQELGQQIQEFLDALFSPDDEGQSLADSLGNLFWSVINMALDVWSGLDTSTQIAIIGGIILAILVPAITGAILTAVGTIFTTWLTTTVLPMIGTALLGVGSFLSTTLTATVMPAVLGILETVGSALLGFFALIPTWLIAAILVLSLLIYNFRDEIVEFLDGLLDKIENFFGKNSGIGAVLSAFVNIIKNIVNLIYNVVAGVMSLLKGDFNSAKSYFSSAFKSLANVIIGIINGVLGGIQSLCNGIVGTINFLIESVNGIIEAVGDLIGRNWTVGFRVSQPHIPRIPYLAQGAVIPANSPFLAMLGDQKQGTNVEAPLETIKQAVAEVLATQSGGGNYQFTAQLNRRVLFDEMISEAKLRQNATGFNAFELG